jgi:hypothetical protein
MADNLTPQKETAIVNTLENNLRNPEARNTGDVFQQQLGNLSHAEQQQIINKINQDKQAEGYGKDNPLPALTLHDDGVVKEKVAGNDEELTVWKGNSGGNPANDTKAPDSYTSQLEHGGVRPAAESFLSDLPHDPYGAIKAAGQTVADVATGATASLIAPEQTLIERGKQGH